MNTRRMALLVWHLSLADRLAEQLHRDVRRVASRRRQDLGFVRYELGRARFWAELARKKDSEP